MTKRRRSDFVCPAGHHFHYYGALSLGECEEERLGYQGMKRDLVTLRKMVYMENGWTPLKWETWSWTAYGNKERADPW